MAGDAIVWRVDPGDGSATPFLHRRRLSTFPLSIAEGTDGNVWIGGYTGGLARVHPDGSVKIFLRSVGGIAGIAPAPHGTLWITIQQGTPAIGRFQHGSLLTFPITWRASGRRAR